MENKKLYFDDTDLYGLKRIKLQKNKSLLLRKSNSDPNNSISITYKNFFGEIGQLKITKMGDQWYTEWENEEGEPIEIFKKTVMEIVNQIFNDYCIT